MSIWVSYLSAKNFIFFPLRNKVESFLPMEKVESLERDHKSFSECSSGCKSGWTLYLCESNGDSLTTSFLLSANEEDKEEDLSMLSDASSGPPHAAEEDCINFYYCSTFANGISKRRNDGEDNRQKQRRQGENALLDDTATSSVSSSCSSKKIAVEDDLELSCGFSANHFKKKAALKK